MRLLIFFGTWLLLGLLIGWLQGGMTKVGGPEERQR